MRRRVIGLIASACFLQAHVATAQGLTGTLIGSVRDAQGEVVSGAIVRLSSPALIGGPVTLTTNEAGQLRFPALPLGQYALDIEAKGFSPYHEEDIRIGINATIERTTVLNIAGVEESLVIEGAGSRLEARGSGFETRFGPDDLKLIPVRRFSMFDFIRAAPGISATSPGTSMGKVCVVCGIVTSSPRGRRRKASAESLAENASLSSPRIKSVGASIRSSASHRS